jgi:hypothetical protein
MGKKRPVLKLTTHVHKEPYLMRETMPPIPPYAFLKCAKTDFAFTAGLKWFSTLSYD